MKFYYIKFSNTSVYIYSRYICTKYRYIYYMKMSMFNNFMIKSNYQKKYSIKIHNSIGLFLKV